MRIAIFCIWIGPLPDNFKLWLKSVSHNKSFDFYLLTDQVLDYQLPGNLIVQKTTLEDLKTLFSAKLGLEVKLHYAYKLCDFKPAFGYLFSEKLGGYTHWGYCDIDMIFGDLSKFITPEILNEYDRVFHRGHLCIYRNNDFINTVFKSSSLIDYKKIFTNPKTCMFDEWLGISKICDQAGVKTFHEDSMADISPNSLRFTLTNGKNYDEQLFLYEGGNVYQYFVQNGAVNRKEYAYIHFQKRRMNITGNQNNGDRYVVNAKGISSFNTELSEEVIKKYNQPNIANFVRRYYKRLYAKFIAKQSIIDYSLRSLN